MEADPKSRYEVVLTSLFGDGAGVLRENNFQLLLLVNVCPILGVSLISPVLESLISPLGSSPANIGLMMSLYTAPGILMIPIAGVVADRYGRKPVLTLSLLAFGLGGSLIAFTTDFRVVLGLRFLQGIGFGGIFPTITTSIGDIYRGNEETAAQGFRVTVGGLSATVFPLIAGGLVVASWRYPFLLYTIAFPIAAATHLWFTEPIRSAHSPKRTTRDGTSYRRRFFNLVRQRRVLPIVIARGLPQVAWTAFLTYNSIIIVQFLRGDPIHAGASVALGSLVFSVVASQVSRIMGHFHTRFYPLIGANISLAVGLLLVLFTSNLGIAMIGVVVLGIGMGITMSLYRSLVTDLSPTSLRGSVVSLAAAVDRIMATATPIGMGILIAVLAPVIGFASSLRIAGVAAATFGGVGGMVCVIIAMRGTPENQ